MHKSKEKIFTLPLVSAPSHAFLCPEHQTYSLIHKALHNSVYETTLSPQKFTFEPKTASCPELKQLEEWLERKCNLEQQRLEEKLRLEKERLETDIKKEGDKINP
jgi:hypothetical protein